MHGVQIWSPALAGGVFSLIFSLGLEPCASQSPPGFTVPPGFTDKVVYLDRDAVGVFGTRGFAVDPATDEIYVAIESSVYRVDASGQRVLVDDLGPGQEVGLLVRPTGSREIFYTSLAGGTVYRRNLETGTTESAKGPRSGFDLVVTDADEVLISGNPFWPDNPNNGIWFTPPGGAPREVVKLSGPSGPVLLDPDGDLLYATQHPDFPPPAGSTRILRFSRDRLAQTLAGGAPLTEADGQVLLAGLDGAFDLAMDDRGRLLISMAGDGKVLRTLPASFVLDPVPMGSVAGSALQMEFHGRSEEAPFAEYQPARAGALHLLASNFVDAVTVHRAEPARPTVSSSPANRATPGSIDFLIQDGPPFGQGWLLASFAPPSPELPLIHLDGLPIWVALDLGAPMFSKLVPLDQIGATAIPLVHPGGFDANVHLQVVTLGIDPAGAMLWGSSLAYTLLLER